MTQEEALQILINIAASRRDLDLQNAETILKAIQAFAPQKEVETIKED